MKTLAKFSKILYNTNKIKRRIEMINNLLAKNNWGSIIMLAVIVVALIGMFVWQTIASKKKQKEAKELLDGIKVGDRVKTIGGICGFIVEVCDKDNTFVLRTGLNGNECYIRFDRGAIYQTAPEGVEEAKEETPVVEAPVEEVKVEEVKEETPAVEEVAKPKKTRAKKSAPAVEEAPEATQE